MPEKASDKTIGRLSIYRRLLHGLRDDGARNVYSHQLAQAAGVTAVQVRRDLMAVGCNGSPTRGYPVGELIGGISHFLDGHAPQAVALVGVGNLGRAILTYFAGRRPNLDIAAAFDSDPHKVGRLVNGCPCYAIDELGARVAAEGIRTAVIAVPSEAAQAVADTLVWAGVKGLLNFAPVALRVPLGVYVEDIDMTTSIEKVAFFARLACVGQSEPGPGAKARV